MKLPGYGEISATNATVNKDDRAKLAEYLSQITHDDELFLRCIKKAVKSLLRYSEIDKKWLDKWLPIIFRKINHE